MTSLATKKLGYVVLGLLAAVVLGIGAAKLMIGQMNSPDVEQLIREGDQQFTSKNYTEALRLYLEAEQIKPNSNEIRDKIDKVDGVIKNLQAGNKPPNQTSGRSSFNSSQGTSGGQPANGETGTSPNGTQTADQPAQNGDKTVPNLVGLTLDQAQQVLLQNGIRYQYVIEASSEPPNTVFKQSINPGQPYPSGERIMFYVSRGQ